MSILDVGCAAGGFYKIFKSLQPMISYTGVDVSEEMIKKAMQLHKSVPFKVINGSNLDFNNDSFDLVFCSGVLHNTLNWRALLKECWRVAREYFVFDVRLIQDAPSVEDMTISYQKIAFSNQWDEKSVVPYAVLNVNDFLTFVKKLKPQPMVLRAFGYFNPVSNMAVTPHKEACMTMFCLSKVAKEGEKNEWKVPLDLPAGIM
jgi:SAM-dependent methyltransferase